MAFNIKNDETHQLAKDIADLTGESMVQAVDSALRERHHRLTAESRFDETMKLAVLGARHADQKFTSEDVADFLYDEHGLPK